jgi:hypothetical protein
VADVVSALRDRTDEIDRILDKDRPDAVQAAYDALLALRDQFPDGAERFASALGAEEKAERDKLLDALETDVAWRRESLNRDDDTSARRNAAWEALWRAMHALGCESPPDVDMAHALWRRPTRSDLKLLEAAIDSGLCDASTWPEKWDPGISVDCPACGKPGKPLSLNWVQGQFVCGGCWIVGAAADFRFFVLHPAIGTWRNVGNVVGACRRAAVARDLERMKGSGSDGPARR